MGQQDSLSGLRPVICLVLQVGDAEKFPQALGLENLDSFHRVSKEGPFLAVVEDGADERLV